MLKQYQFILPSSNIIMACHISGVYDVNRNLTLDNDNYDWVHDWATSIEAQGLHGVLFHNSFSNETCKEHENKHISFIKIDYDRQFNPNVYRYFLYRDFIHQHKNQIKNVFVTDVSDVVLVKNPFLDPFFVDNSTVIFCGDEDEILQNEWMQAHGDHLRSQMEDYAKFEKDFSKETLLNCGIIGGAMPIFIDFLNQLCSIHSKFNRNNQTAFTGDMGAFNFLVRTQFNHQVKHGAPVNTVFKQYENDRTDCWFRHK